MTRKNFINTFFRGLILGGLTLIVAIFTFENKVSINENCEQPGFCRSCGKLTKCSLPEASKYKANGKG